LDGGDDYFRGGGSLVAYVKDYTISDKKYFNSGREYERERIIKALETSFQHEIDRELNEEGTAWSVKVHSSKCELCKVLSKFADVKEEIDE
jgi:hypothetical protein